MSTPQVERFDSPEALASEVASRFLDVLADAQAAGRTPHVALTGGTIADKIHQEIARQADASGVDWGAVDFWWGDERYVAPDSPDRNAVQARKAFLDAVGATRVHEMPSTAAACSVDEGARAYAAEIRNSSGGDFDIVMLGMGPDGHVASLFPGFPQVDVTDEIAVGVTGSPKPPPERISLTVEALCRAKRVWFVVADEEKLPVAERAISGDQSLPAARVHAVPHDSASDSASGQPGDPGKSGEPRQTGETTWFLSP